MSALHEAVRHLVSRVTAPHIGSNSDILFCGPSEARFRESDESIKPFVFQRLVELIPGFLELCTGPLCFGNTRSESSICACGNGMFLIARQFPWAKVSVRRRGASPSRPVWDPVYVLGFWVVRGEIRGPSRGAAPVEDRTLPPEVNTEEQK